MTRAKPKWNGEFDAVASIQTAKRRMLLREAAAGFNERGFHNVSLDEVAARLGITKAVCYYYFRDKNDLLRSCIEIGFELAEQALKVGEGTRGSGLDKVVAMTRSYVEGLTSELGACAVVGDLNSLQDDDLKVVRQRQRAFGRRLEKMVQRGMDDGSIDVDDARATASWIVSAPLMIPRLAGLWQKGGIDALADKYAGLARRALERRAA